MLVALFVFELVLGGLIVLTNVMISHKFKGIENSLAVYTSSRAYKTCSSIAFIDKMVKRYQESISNLGEKMDLDMMIRSQLAKEPIGIFSYISVKNIATKTRLLMWGIIVLEGMIASINQIAFTTPAILMMGSSILLTIAIEIFSLLKGVEEQYELLVITIQDYLLNTYPVQIQNHTIKKKVSHLQDVVIQLEQEIEDQFIQKNQKTLEEALSPQDIANLIRIFD